ncbi:MAG TPA: PQQ-binding-like beta-propeller repeat protein [Dietzia timorensis]|uniref:PQQ-binding-like beta-propeller repeat protein n=1 Tax=Dietzia timorensis TaxID=499555 RepID=A0A921F4R2_9ACTN|nr:PQQ-binding-like beta-propeller repeat protein [Dietzia timorensis]HJE91572.1 PQQ-binding-like beta-propeller repeat protein [Dietzia timorensis]
MRSSTRRKTRAVAALTATAAAALAACSPVSSSLDAHPGQSDDWSSTYSDLHNSSTSTGESPEDPTLKWSREIGAPLPGPATFSPLGDLQQASLSDAGCNVFALELEDGRKSWCNRQAIGGPRISGQINKFGDSYWPILSGAAAISGEGEFRYGTTPPGAATTARQLSGQLVLTVSMFGQARIYGTQHGTPRGAPLDLAGPVPDVAPDYGLSWCETGSRGCPAPAPAAVTDDGSTFFITVWTPGADEPDLVAVRVNSRERANPDEHVPATDPQAMIEMTELWRTPLPHGRTGAPVVLSEDEDVAYVTGPEGISAFSTEDGSERWHHTTGVETDFAPAVSADGTIVLGGRTGAFYRGEDDAATDEITREALTGSAVLALHDDGDSASEVWRDDRAASLTAPVLSANGNVLLASREGRNGMAIRALGADGEELWSKPVPGAQGPVAGLTLADSGAIALSLSIGRVYLFADD